MDDKVLQFELTHSAVAPFPRAKFLQFLSRLKVQSKDFGLVPFSYWVRSCTSSMKSAKAWIRG